MAAVPREKNIPIQPAGYVLVPAATIGGLSMILAGGLDLLGFLGRMNAGIARGVSRGQAENFPQRLPEAAIWLAAGLFAFVLAAAILATRGHGRRLVLWVTAVFLVAAWAPVLSLAAYFPGIAAPWIATLWSGVCALVYAANHRMACDASPRANRQQLPPPADDPR
jgi:hypothetical protein